LVISYGDILLDSIILTTDNEIGPALWYFFIIALSIVGLIAIILIFIRSKQPEEWEHKPLTDENYTSGSLTNLAESIRTMPVDYSDNSSLKTHIEMMFYEKIRNIYGFSIGELVEMKNTNPEKLKALIKDHEITDWILNFQNKEKNVNQGFFDKNKISKKEIFLQDLNQIINKMERWEK